LFKNIFSKLLTVNFVVILITFIILGIFLFSLLGDYVTSEKEEVLRYSGKKINEMTSMLIENHNPIVERLYRMNLESYGANTQSFIIVVDKEGKILAFSDSRYRMYEGKQLSKEQYEETLKGNEIKKIGNFGGMFDETVLTVGLPLYYKGQIVGAVFLNSPIPDINRVNFDIFKLFMISASASIVAAFILIYFLSKSISDPIKAINKAAKTIANGHFDHRVTVRSKDEIGELSNTFNNMADSLQNLENMRRNFISNVSHELRTPMTTISGFVEGIIDETIPAEKHSQYLKIVLDETKRLSRLVNDLLDLAKMEAGEVNLDLREFDINEMIRIAIIKFENRIMEKNIHVSAYFGEEQNYVKADMDGIQRVITNLLDNAVKFCNVNGNIEISVTADNRKVYVSILNTGIGIAQEELKYIWDRFYKSDKSRSKDKTGTGLGLSIVKNIINQHNQGIWVDSKEGEYTRFTFSLEKV